MKNGVAALVAVLAVGCSNGAERPERLTQASAPPSATATATVEPTPTAERTQSESAEPVVGGWCAFVTDGSPETLPPLVAKALGVPKVEQDPKHSANYANAEVCRFVPPGKAAPYADVFVGNPDELTYDTKATHPTRRDEPDLPGEAYSFTEGDAVTVVLRSGEGEAAVTAGGLGARNRDAARALMAELIRLSRQTQP